MTSGGARARSGPAPDPLAFKRERDGKTWLTLVPRIGDVPSWPLTESTKREDAMWARLWSTPQSSQWEPLGLHDQVATYVRTFCEGTVADGSTQLRTLLMRQEEGLGLSTAGLARLLWRLPAAEPAAAPEVKRPNGSRRSPAYSTFDTIIGGKTA